MNALVWIAAEEMVMKQLEFPEMADHEVFIRVEVAGICGSEIEGYLGHNSLRIPPLVMGHEFCGIIEKVGAQVKGELQEGQRVVVNPLLYCDQCDRCRQGLTQLCPHRQIIGIHHPGAFAEHVVVPASAVVPVPSSLNPFRASLSEPLACSLRASRRALQRHPLAHVVIFGAGGIGLLCAMTAKILGAQQILIVDTNEERLSVAHQLGIGITSLGIEEQLRETVAAEFGSRGVDVVIDAAGFQPTREMAVKLLQPGGTFMNIGLGIDDTSLPMNHIIRNEIDIMGSFCYSRHDFQEAVHLLATGKVTEEGWTEVRALAEGATAFEELVRGKVKSGKIFLEI